MENRNTIQSIVFAVVLGLTSQLGKSFLGTPNEDMVEDMKRLADRIEVLEATCGNP